MSFFDSLRLAIALGLTLFLVLLRFDSERITRSDYFRYRTPWLGPVSYYIAGHRLRHRHRLHPAVGRSQLFLTGGDPDKMLPVMLLFMAIALLNAVGPRLPALRRHPAAPVRAAAFTVSRRRGQRDQRGDPVPLDRARHAALRRRADRLGASPSRRWSTASRTGACGASATGTSSPARCSSAGRRASRPCRPARSSRPSSATSR